eukprot:COSAG02_NODE_2443_length_8852_cov_63.348795_4_plen_74_part_00
MHMDGGRWAIWLTLSCVQLAGDIIHAAQPLRRKDDDARALTAALAGKWGHAEAEPATVHGTSKMVPWVLWSLS